MDATTFTHLAAGAIGQVLVHNGTTLEWQQHSSNIIGLGEGLLPLAAYGTNSASWQAVMAYIAFDPSPRGEAFLEEYVNSVPERQNDMTDEMVEYMLEMVDLSTSILTATNYEDEVGRCPTSEGEEILCCICQENYEVGQRVARTNMCNHLFHRSCIVSWLLGTNITCPVCRASLGD